MDDHDSSGQTAGSDEGPTPAPIDRPAQAVTEPSPVNVWTPPPAIAPEGPEGNGWLPPVARSPYVNVWTPPPPFEPTASGFQDYGQVAAYAIPGPRFVSAGRAAKIVQVLLGLAGLLSLVRALYFIYGVNVQGQLITAHALQPDADRYNSALSAMGLLSLGLLLVSGIAFMQWMWRSVKNASILGAGEGISSPAVAVVAWIVPFYNLIQPYRIMVNLHDRLLYPLQSQPGRWLIRCWWAFWLLGGLVGEVALTSIMGSQTTVTGASRLGVMSSEALAAAILAADAVLAIVVVRQIQRLSDARLVAREGDPNRAIELVATSQRRRVTSVPFAVAAVAIIAIAIPTGIVYAQASAPPSWAQFAPSDASFSASMPSQPVETKIPSQVSGQLVISGDTFRSASNENLVFVITYYDYPIGSLSALSTSTIYANMDKADPAIIVDGETDMTLSGKPAHEIHAHKLAVSVVAIYVVSGDRIYVAEADFTTAQAGSADINRFLSSFSVK
jgi:hypothetical protein